MRGIWLLCQERSPFWVPCFLLWYSMNEKNQGLRMVAKNRVSTSFAKRDEKYTEKPGFWGQRA
jgi:hypothetical protein